MPSLDVNASVSALNSISSHVMSSLVRVKPGRLEGAKNELEGDIARTLQARGLLRDGQFVEVTLVLEVRENRAVIPEEAVMTLGGKLTVYVVEASGGG